MNVVNELSGQHFGRLEVLQRAENTPEGRAAWTCRCECGNIVTVTGKRLRNGNTKSCGCYNLDKIKERRHIHGMRKSRLYRIWSNMKSRCTNPNVPCYHLYGGKGIHVCVSWQTFESFMEWALSNGYDDSLTIDRIDSEKNYDPANCRWATAKEQANNTSRNRKIEYRGKTQTVSQWSEELMIPRGTLVSRLNAGRQLI